MPAMYTHHAFAKEVRERLRPPYRKTADTFENEYMIGAQGPDFLFFYYPFTKNKVKDEGERIHHEAARLLFEPARDIVREKGIDSCLLYTSTPCGSAGLECMCISGKAARQEIWKPW